LKFDQRVTFDTRGAVSSPPLVYILSTKIEQFIST